MFQIWPFLLAMKFVFADLCQFLVLDVKDGLCQCYDPCDRHKMTNKLLSETNIKGKPYSKELLTSNGQKVHQRCKDRSVLYEGNETAHCAAENPGVKNVQIQSNKRYAEYRNKQI
ncbi:hypothetical protein OS493_026766 [Desmophyllum pertusum]|uniref:Secreted protein n=1 Tax=Desmophyllum pertusum TaxID=174260 RepID=A0A9W9ZL12_9CNID|nr:hypothetical protein OS493_026766 [Desmophyllum pertusum]